MSFHPTVLHNLGLCSLYAVNFETLINFDVQLFFKLDCLSVSENYVKLCGSVDSALNFCNTNNQTSHQRYRRYKENNVIEKLFLQRSSKADDCNALKLFWKWKK